MASLDHNPEPFYSFQAFDDGPNKDPALARIFHGDLDDHLDELLALNDRGAGIFVCINETNGQGRRASNVTRVRAVFTDLDTAPIEPALRSPIAPHIVAESSPCKWHAYWLVADCALERFESIQSALAAKFNGDPVVHDLARVMRLPGFLHQKDPEAPFVVRIVYNVSCPPYAVDELIAGLDLQIDTRANAPGPFEMPYHIPIGARNDTLYRAACHQRARGWSRDGILAALRIENQKLCEHPLEDDELVALVDSAERHRAGDDPAASVLTIANE
ncbi:MAG: DNA-primase RepB domain-containing protein, partial [Vulcanimicrobiaceae bacterium]